MCTCTYVPTLLCFTLYIVAVMAMYYATRKDGLDCPDHPVRSPNIPLNEFFSISLRTGFSLQLLSLIGLIMTHFSYGGKGFYTYDLSGLTEENRLNESFRNVTTGLSIIYLGGSLCLLTFQIILADDTCWTRGYRSGSKILRLATFLDTLASTLQFIFHLYIAKFYTTRWYILLNEGGSELVLFLFTRVIHAFALILFGVACYLLEVYHDEGAGDLHAYINSILFILAGFFELLKFMLNLSVPFVPTLLLALFAAALWAIYFEPEVTFTSPALNETELTNDVEHQVEKFTHLTPMQA